MGRYRKYQPSNSTSAVGMSMGSPRLVSKNLHFQVAKEASFDGPSYANVTGAFPRQSPIMGRRALGPPNAVAQSPKFHRRQTSEVIKQEVGFLLPPCDHKAIKFDLFRCHMLNNSLQCPILRVIPTVKIPRSI